MTDPRSDIAPPRRLRPHASPTVQLLLAALVWTVPALLLPSLALHWRDAIDRPTAWRWALPLAVLGALKAWVLTRAARRAVARIEARGTAFVLGFFAPRMWLIIAAMIIGGRLLRAGPLPRGSLALVYLAVGGALLASSVVFWRAIVRRRRR